MAVDFGDAPEPYPTALADDGARHEANGPTLGDLRDEEADGQPSTGADGDGADEDGVAFGSIRVGQLDASVIVNVRSAPAGAKLDAWIDFNGDGSWGGPFEHIADSLLVDDGSNTITFDVPSWAESGDTYARFRLSTEGDLGVGGSAADGEVEDYWVTFTPPTPAPFGAFSGEKTVSGAVDFPTSVFAADVDGDGDMDVLSASGGENKIAWYENDGSEGFTSHTISTDVRGPASVFAVDMDGDGDIDVLSASARDETIDWYENDGSGGFTAHTLETHANSVYSVFAADVDGDGDVDVLSAAASVDRIEWYENDGSEGFTAHTISSDARGAYGVFAADVDGDGDLDVLGAASFDDKIAWYENDGSGGFTSHTISTDALAAVSVFAADVDGDGDLDVISASLFDNKIAWYENVGFDHGDAPLPYPTSRALDGAVHAEFGPTLGVLRDTESDGQPTAGADGDGDDEDGVILGSLSIGQLGAVAVVNVGNTPAGALLDAWIDFDGNGSWDDPLEQILQNATVSPGSNTLGFSVPATAVAGLTFARFRLSTAGNLEPTGLASDGEVEDYALTILGNMTLSLPSGNGANDVTLRLNGAELELFDNITSAVIVRQTLSLTNAVMINGVDGEDDRLTVDYDFGGFFALPGGVRFDGGSRAGDEVIIQGTGTTLGRYLSRGSQLGEALIELTDGAAQTSVRFTGVEPLSVVGMAGFDVAGTLPVGGQSLRIDAATFTTLDTLTVVDGGSIRAPGGIHLDAGEILLANGTVDAPVASERGSTITLTGDLAIGDASAFDGVDLAGRLNVGSHAVTLNDGHKAVLGSQTTIGSGGDDGTLIAASGIALEDNRTLVGQGVVRTSNGEFENQGFVQATGNGIIFNNLVTGAGGFGSTVDSTITFLGGYEPGNSPAQINVLGNVRYGPANVLVLDIGGLLPGQEFDRIDVTGEVTLDGVLRIEPIRLDNDYEFRPGDQFDVMTFGSHGGEFSSYEGLDLGDGLSLEPSLTDDGLRLTVIQSLLGDLTGNGFVDFQDLTVLLANWNQNVSAADGNLVEEGTSPVNFQDLTVLLAAWTGPGPAASPQPAATEATVHHTPTIESHTAASTRFDQLTRRAHTPSRRIDPSTKLSPHDSPLRRLQAAAVDRAMGDYQADETQRRDMISARGIRRGR